MKLDDLKVSLNISFFLIPWICQNKFKIKPDHCSFKYFNLYFSNFIMNLH